ncbi:SRPBCC family protein [Cytobacillus sp. FSL K6-0265]|uniref:SRPBCC family protein n=1 Tax=Cytobacillus sp. FSL K6-0265 TaxID=2921448 RepID=UPI0030FA5AD5
MNELKDIQQSIILNAPINTVWQHVATSKGIAEWFMPNNFQAIEGIAFEVQSPFGPSPCRVLEIDEPNKLSFSWDTDGWVVTFLLAEVDNGTKFTLIHSGWKEAGTILTKPNEKSEIIRERMNIGWEAIVQKRLRMAIEQS